MAEATIPSNASSAARGIGHRAWIRICHWLVALGFITLAVSGIFILMVHPRLYWGEVGNDLTPALLELPISNNHRPEGWQRTVSFGELLDAPFSANRTYQIFNQNGWARSLHFLAGWLFVLAGAVYVVIGLLTRHIVRDLLPRLPELRPQPLWRDIKAHLRFELGAGGGPPYGLLQRLAYASVALIVLPFMVISGLAMSPRMTAAFPVLLDLFGGYQSARTLHFFGFAALMLFFVMHVVMVALTGFREQLRAMIIGR